ncbi:MAG TPA: hypothetical protein VGQ05_09065 [Streptosporangiaceae bacterium]|nr:hypothetical protein [Streptosporangiaceae bacterium]
MYEPMNAPPPGDRDARDICWTRTRPPGRTRAASSAPKAGYWPAPTCSSISTAATASYSPPAPAGSR